MQAIAVRPGEPDSAHLRDVPAPTREDIPGPSGVLVELLRVGVDGTDREIAAGEYGVAPEGDDHLIIGHESLGRVLEAGPAVPPWLSPGRLVTATVRRPGSSIYDAVGLQDFTTNEEYYERGISRLHGFLTERYVEDARFLVPVPDVLASTGHLLEPISVVEKAIAQAFEIQRRVKVWQPQRAAVLGGGPLGLLAVLALRLRRLDVTCLSLREPPSLNSELVERLGARYLSTKQTAVAEAAVAHGPFDLILEGTGYSPLVFESAEALARNGVLVMLSLTGGDRTATVNSDALNQGFVLGNKVMVGSVNASYEDFANGVDDLLKGHAVWPGWLDALLTNPIPGLAGHERMMAELTGDAEAIKVYVEIADPERAA